MLEDINQCSLPPTGIPLPAEIDHVMEALRARLAQPEPVIQARKEGDLIVADLPQVPRGSGGISKDAEPTIDGWPLYSGLPPAKVQDERETQYKSWAQSAQVIGTPKCEWINLTVQEREKLRDEYGDNPSGLISAVQMILKEKNNG